MIMFFVGVYKVEAKTMVFPDMTFDWDNGITSVPTQDYWFPYQGGTRRETFFVYNWSGYSNPMTYIITEWCTMNPGMIEQMYISNTNYSSNYINDGTGVSYMTGETCTSGGYTGYKVKKQFQVGKWGELDDAGELVAGAYINMTNGYSYGIYYRLDNIYLSDTDELSAIAESQKNMWETIEALESQTNTIIQNNNAIKDAIIQNQKDTAQDIVDAVTGPGLSDITTQPADKEDYENTHEKEEELLEEWKPTDEELGNVDLEIEQEPADYMWNLLERILKTNERILYLVMSILVVGVIKLIMGR